MNNLHRFLYGSATVQKMGRVSKTLLKGYVLGAAAGFGACFVQTPCVCNGPRDVVNYWGFCAVGCALWPLAIPSYFINRS